LKASNTGSFDFFGHSVSISGNTIAVTAPLEDSNSTGVNGAQNDQLLDSGAAYVFVRNGTTWSQQAFLKASTTAGLGDWFGESIAVSGNIVAVGQMLEDSDATGVNGDPLNSNAVNSGAVFVFRRIGTTWSQYAYLKSWNTGLEDRLGRSVDVSGDWLVAGADFEDSNATGIDGDFFNDNAKDSGAAYVYDLDSNPGTSMYGAGTPGCSGPHTIDVNNAPIIGSPGFAITCDNAPPSSLGLGIVTDSPDLNGSDPFGLGAILHVDFFAATEVLSFDFVSDPIGFGLTVNTGIPSAPALIGKNYYAMALWVWTSCSLPPFNLSTSPGLAMTILAP
jgi:hypothetical protein